MIRTVFAVGRNLGEGTWTTTTKYSRLELTVSIVSAYVSKNSIPMANLPDLVTSVHETLGKLGGKPSVSTAPLVPAVPVKKSVTPDYLISLEDGRKLKSLKRHLSTKYGMTPEQYRAKWGLPADYPMVAPNLRGNAIEPGPDDGTGPQVGRSRWLRARPPASAAAPGVEGLEGASLHRGFCGRRSNFRTLTCIAGNEAGCAAPCDAWPPSVVGFTTPKAVRKQPRERLK